MNKKIGFFLITIFIILGTNLYILFLHNKIHINNFKSSIAFDAKIISQKASELIKKNEIDKLTTLILDYSSNNIVSIEQLLIYHHNEVKYNFLNLDKNNSDFNKYFKSYLFLENNKNSTSFSVTLYDIKQKKIFMTYYPVFNDSKEIYETIYIFFNIKTNPFFSKTIAVIIFSMLLMSIFFISLSYIEKKSLSQKILKLTSYVEESMVIGKWPKKQMMFTDSFAPLEKELVYFCKNKKDLEKEYEHLNQKFNLLINQSNDGILIENLNGELIFVNEKLVSLLNYNDANELLGKKFTDFIYDKQSIDVYNAQTLSRKTTKASRYTIELRTKDDKKISCIVSGAAHYDKYGNVTEYYGTISDINLISHLKDKFGEIDSSPLDSNLKLQVPYFVINEDNIITDAHPQISSILEISKEHLLQKDVNVTLQGYSELLNILSLNSNKDHTYEIFEPYLNKWLFIQVTHQKIHSSISKIFSIIDISHARDIEKFHNYVFNDMEGFIFFTNEYNELLYISSSFSKISGHDTFWFEEYYEKVFQKLYLKNGHLTTDEIMLIFVHKPPTKFKIYYAKNNDANINIFICNKLSVEI